MVGRAQLSLARGGLPRCERRLEPSNVVAGASWWAFWPLAVTAFLLGLHYLAYKAMTANEQWAEERVKS